MILPDNDYQILHLTDEFFKAYPNPPYTELLKKMNRAYNCLLFQTHYGYYICVPYRTEIKHEYAFHFRNTHRSSKHRSGLDYTKIVIICNPSYIGSSDALIDRDEYRETMINLERIKGEALRFVEEYIVHVNGIRKLHPMEFKRRYFRSSLQYFHAEMGI